MKKVSVQTYRKDALYPKVASAIARILRTSDEISPIAILLEMGNLEAKMHEAWCRGQVPYLESVFQGSLAKANRILRIIGFHAHDLNMLPSQQTYRQKGKKIILRFSKAGDRTIEMAYMRHYKWNQSQEKKQRAIETTLSEQSSPADPKADTRFSVG